jgi:anti-sigma regulatory factor (Ser/Thr protein kinase)
MRKPEQGIPTVHGRLDFAVGQLRRLRELVSAAAHRAGLDKWRQESLVVAVNEAAINAIEHGGGRGHLDLVQDDHRLLIAQVSDHGPGLPPGLEQVCPEPEATRGRGLWLMRESCDRVELHGGPSGTMVRLEMDLCASATG